MRRSKVLAVLVGFSAALLVPLSRAVACPDGQYEACVFGGCICLPNGGIVTKGLNPLPDTLNTVAGVLKGDVNAISTGIGGLVIKASCPGCAVAAQTLLSSPDKQFVEAVVGRGWLIFVATGAPVLVLVDAARSMPRQYALTRPPVNPLQAPPPSSREQKLYRVEAALCAVGDGAGNLVAGWVDPPSFVETATKVVSEYPIIDVFENDVVEFAVENTGCPLPPPGQAQLTSVRMKYGHSNAVPAASPTAMKYFVTGKPI